jgi:hypothetical protein
MAANDQGAWEFASRKPVLDTRASDLLAAQVTPTRLERIFSDVAHALDQSQLSLAVRLADSARRLAPRNPTCILLYAQLLSLSGAPAEAIEALAPFDGPDAMVVHGEALWAFGHWKEAVALCETLLWKYAADSFENLSAFAGRICSNDGDARHPGWIGVDTEFRLTGDFPTDAGWFRLLHIPTATRINRFSHGLRQRK